MSDVWRSKGAQGVANIYEPNGFAVMRTPLLPFDIFLKWSALASTNATADAPLPAERELCMQRERLAEFVQKCFTQPPLREALFVASPDLHDALEKAEAGDTVRSGDRVLLGLARYLTRATFRSTPFGLFAGCSLIPIRPRTNLQLDPVGSYMRHSRFDMGYLGALTRELGATSEIRRSVKLYPNSSAHVGAGQVHYVAATHVDHVRHYSLDAVNASKLIQDTLARASGGATFQSLAAALVDFEVTIADASAFIDELLDAQLLIPEIDPTITGGDAAHTLLADIENICERSADARALRAASADLRDVDAMGVGVCTSAYARVAHRLEELPVTLNRGRLFQVDLYKPATHAGLGEAVVLEASRAAELFCRLADRVDPLADFVDRFRDRYEDREVPLLEALDDEIGVGLESTEPSGPWALRHAEHGRRRDAWLADLRSRASLLGVNTIALSELDVSRLVNQPINFPDSLAVVATLMATSPETLDTGDFQLLVQYCHGPSGASLLGRFAHLNPTLRKHVEELMRAEECHRPDALFAEIIHLPQGRLGNVLSRPALRPYEIPYLGRASVSFENQIAVTDLTVSVTNGRLRLRSQRLGREIIPRLSSAHNFSHRAQLPVYRFLGMLQCHGLPSGLAWNWGAHEAVASFLPRVTSGRLVLTRARWLVPESELQLLSSTTGTARVAATRGWRVQRQVPRMVLLADGDNHLPLDLENPICVDVFADLTRRRRSATLVELLPAPSEVCAYGPEGMFTHELVIPLTKTAPSTRLVEPISGVGKTEAVAPIRSRRVFAPGSEWFFVKLYSGPGIADRILRELVAPFALAMVRAKLVSHWFYVPYKDPHFHLRLRFCGKADVLQKLVVPQLTTLVTPFLDDGSLSRVQHDTYVREIERYGGDEGIVYAEHLFFADSECAVELRERLDGSAVIFQDRPFVHLHSTIAAVNSLFDAFDYPLDRRCALLESMSHSTPATRKSWGDWYRHERKEVEAMLSPEAPESTTGWRASALSLRMRRILPIAKALRALELQGALSRTIDDLLVSFSHMCSVRHLKAAQVRLEPMCYDALLRYNKSLVGRGTTRS